MRKYKKVTIIELDKKVDLLKLMCQDLYNQINELKQQ